MLDSMAALGVAPDTFSLNALVKHCLLLHGSSNGGQGGVSAAVQLVQQAMATAHPDLRPNHHTYQARPRHHRACLTPSSWLADWLTGY